MPRPTIPCCSAASPRPGRHPLAPGGSLGNRVSDGIAREKALLGPLLDAADMVIDTSELPLPRLRQMIAQRFKPEGGPPIAVQVLSFGFPRGLPRDADLVFDVRCLPNPHYDPRLRPLTGRDAEVVAFLEAEPEVLRMRRHIQQFVADWLPSYVGDNRSYLTVAIGCTGGKHRSVYLVEQLAKAFAGDWRVLKRHRDHPDTR